MWVEFVGSLLCSAVVISPAFIVNFPRQPMSKRKSFCISFGSGGAAGVPVTPYAGDPSAGPVASAAMYGRGAPTPGKAKWFFLGISLENGLK